MTTFHVRLIAAVCVGAVMFSCGCQTGHWVEKKTVRAAQQQLGQLDVHWTNLAATTKIIDIHTHTFNARYLPLEGIIEGKRDAFFPVTTLISDRCSSNIAKILVDATTLGPGPGKEPGIARSTATRSIHAGWICRIFIKLIKRAENAGVWSDSDPQDPGKVESSTEKVRRQLKAVDKMATNMTMLERIAVRAAAHMMGVQDHSKGLQKGDEIVSGTQSFMRFVWTLTQDDNSLANIYQAMHEGVEKNGPILMISQTMDLAPVYNQREDGRDLLNFREQVLPRMRARVGQDFKYFVAYNPYRLDGLKLVQDEWQIKGGAIGVKVYPPSGYRPAGNQIKRRPHALFTGYPDQQWKARYAALGSDDNARNAELDQRLRELLQWCAANNVPVLVHAGYGEFEARKGYGEYHSNPKFWEEYLASESVGTNLCTLRLCLGHAGGEDFWFGEGKHWAWGENVMELCEKYPNVYCEVTTSEKILSDEPQAHFAARLDQAFHNHPGFAKKMIYGTDWPLPDRGKPEAVLRATQKVFLLPQLAPFYRQYFSENAMAFLGLQQKPQP